jgi:predicted RNase H-like nuclease (RuvC/YqgF family)
MTESERGTEREQHDRLQAEYRWEASPEGELKRALWAAQEEISRLEAENKRLAQQVADQQGSISRTREAIRKACNRLADPYDHLHGGLWVDERLGLQDLVENIVWDLLTQRGNVERLQRQSAGLKGGE